MLRAVTPIQIGICSWADEGLVKRWYPRGVSSAEARLRYYAERFDTVEVDSPFYRLPKPETAGRWAERTPDGFVFHAKASKSMTSFCACSKRSPRATFGGFSQPSPTWRAGGRSPLRDGAFGKRVYCCASSG